MDKNKHQIQSFSFGEIQINHKKYHKDLIILPNRIIDHWWRDQGHLLQPQDLEVIKTAQVQILIVGTGTNGIMKVASKTKEFLKQEKIKLIAQKTSQAWQTFNDLNQKNDGVAAALHLTC